MTQTMEEVGVVAVDNSRTLVQRICLQTPWWIYSMVLHALVIVLVGLVSMSVVYPHDDDEVILTGCALQPTPVSQTNFATFSAGPTESHPTIWINHALAGPEDHPESVEENYRGSIFDANTEQYYEPRETSRREVYFSRANLMAENAIPEDDQSIVKCDAYAIIGIVMCIVMCIVGIFIFRWRESRVTTPADPPPLQPS